VTCPLAPWRCERIRPVQGLSYSPDSFAHFTRLRLGQAGARPQPACAARAWPMRAIGTPGPHCVIAASRHSLDTSHSRRAPSLTWPTWNMRDVSPW